jgi:hypothetical protein
VLVEVAVQVLLPGPRGLQTGQYRRGGVRCHGVLPCSTGVPRDSAPAAPPARADGRTP